MPYFPSYASSFPEHSPRLRVSISAATVIVGLALMRMWAEGDPLGGTLWLLVAIGATVAAFCVFAVASQADRWSAPTHVRPRPNPSAPPPLRPWTPSDVARNDAMVTQAEILQSVMDNMDEAVIVANERQQYVASNAAADIILDCVLPVRTANAKTGGLFFADATTPVPTHESPLARACRGERQEEVELVIKTSRSAEQRWYRVHGHPVYDRMGVLRGGVVVCRDVTQKQLLERQLLQAQKLEAIGQLAAGIAHEINTPAQYVGDNVRFLSDTLADLMRSLDAHKQLYKKARTLGVASEETALIDAIEASHDLPYLCTELPNAMHEALEGLAHINEIVSAVKGFSHPGTGHMSAVDLNAQVRHTVTVSRNEWKYLADISLELDPALPPVVCFSGDMNQVLLNLIINATDAIDEMLTAEQAITQRPGRGMGNITISTRADGEWAEITVRDSGTGIAPEIRSRVFDPFFTTKDVGRGSGQGLAIAHMIIVEKHGGSIGFESDVGHGTIFTIRIPIRPASYVEEEGA
jgi:signal transduction histidine kinase